MLLENHQQAYHTFFEFYIYQDNILLKEDLQKQLCLNFLSIRNRIKYKQTTTDCFITHSLSLMAFRNKLYCKSISINSFITHVLSHKQIPMHESNYQLL